MKQFLPSPEYTIRAVSYFFQNSRRYSQLKVHYRWRWHRWQTEKIFNHKIFNYLVRTRLGSRVNFQTHFCLQVHFKVSAAWYCSHYLPQVSTTIAKLGGKICRWCLWYRRQFCHGVVDTGGKFASGVGDTGGALWCAISPWIFEKIWNVPIGILLGWGELIQEKNQKQKISWHCPFNNVCGCT